MSLQANVSCSMRLFGKQICCSGCAGSRFILFVVSLLSPVWTETKRLQGKLQWSKLVRLSSSSSWLTVWLADTCCWQRRVRARWANQLIPMSPVAKKRSTDRPMRTEYRERHWFSISPRNPRPGVKENVMSMSQGLLETNLAANGVITLLIQVLRHNDKVAPKKKSNFTSSLLTNHISAILSKEGTAT